MKLKHIPDIFTTHIHKETGKRETPYAEKFKISDTPQALIDKKKEATEALNKAKWRIERHLLIVSIISFAVFLGIASLSRLVDWGIGNKYAVFILFPTIIGFFVLRIEVNHERKKKSSQEFLELVNNIERCNIAIAKALFVKPDAIRVDIVIKEIKYAKGKKSPWYEPELHIKPCYIYKDDGSFVIALEGCLYSFPLSFIYDFVLDEGGIGFYDKGNIIQRKKDLFEKYEISVGQRYCDYCTVFAPNLILDVDGYAYKIIFMSYEDIPMEEFFGMKPKDPTINKEN